MCKAECTIPSSETDSVPVSAAASADLDGVAMLTTTLPAVSIVAEPVGVPASAATATSGSDDASAIMPPPIEHDV